MNNATRSFLGLLILFAVLTLAIFGFSVMAQPGHMMAGCFGTAPGATCEMLPPLEHFAAHLNTFENASMGILQTVALLAVLFIVLFALVARSIDDRGILKKAALDRDGRSRVPQQMQFSRWLSLCEKRDPSSAFAMSQ